MDKSGPAGAAAEPNPSKQRPVPAHHVADRNPLSVAVLHDGPDTRLRAELLCDVHTLRGHSKVLHPNMMHTPQAHTQKLIVLLPACKGSLAIATSRKRGSMVILIKLFSAYVLRNTLMWEHGQGRCAHSAFDALQESLDAALYRDTLSAVDLQLLFCIRAVLQRARVEEISEI